MGPRGRFGAIEGRDQGLDEEDGEGAREHRRATAGAGLLAEDQGGVVDIHIVFVHRRCAEPFLKTGLAKDVSTGREAGCG